MKATFVLTPAEARRLIAKATIQTPEFQKAWKDAYVILAGGTTNAFIAQELGYDVEPGLCTVGSSTTGLLCVTEPSSRKSFPNVFYKGQPVDKKIDEALQDFHADTVIIKGANAIDPKGNVGIITSGFDGGTVPRVIGTMTSFGLQAYAPKWANRFNFLLQLPIIIPWLVSAISLLLLFSFLGSGRSVVSMFLGNLIVVLPYVVLLVNGRFVSMDRSPEAAARLLGASPVRVFFDVTLPAITPGILAGGIMAMIMCFNNFVMQYYLIPIGVQTLPTLVFTRIRSGYQADLNALSAIIVLVAVVIVVILSKLGFSAGGLFGISSGTASKKGE